jgi:hypothetical protein
MKVKTGFMAWFFILVVFASCQLDRDQVKSHSVPVVYSTDLSHPHDDPDDHFDIVTLYALKELDILGIILDQGKRQDRAPGRIPVEQMNALTGRNVPCAVGLSDPLKTPVDQAVGQDTKYQNGVELIIKSLKRSADPVTIITVGSLRDTAAAFNRQPDLFRKKVAKLLIFIGEASANTTEWNVGLDTNAFIRIMNSGLPVWWVPCFDGGNFKNRGNASFWTADQAELLRDAPDSVMNFFIYALHNKTLPHHLNYLYSEVNDQDKALVLTGRRRLWCAAVFTLVAGRIIIEREGEYIPVNPEEARSEDEKVHPFRFLPFSLFVDENARVVYEESERSHTIHRYEIIENDRYARIMTSVTRYLISSVLSEQKREL